MEKSCLKREKSFLFVYPAKTTSGSYNIQINFPIPLLEPLEEYAHRVISAFSLPYYLFSDLLLFIKRIAHEETYKLFDELSATKINEARKQTFDVDSVVKHWEIAFKSEQTRFSEREATSDEELFSVVYHKLVHSPALESILHTEQAMAETARSAALKRLEKIKTLSEKQNKVMSDAVKDLNSRVTEKEINDLAAKQFEEHSLADGRLTSILVALHEQQRGEYRAWLMSVLEQLTVNTSPLPSPVTSCFSALGSLPALNETCLWPDQEESFTIHLGSQLKQMHNVRILAADVLDFCRFRPPSGGIEPRRVETALALYSTGLFGLVLLSDVGPVGGFSGLFNDFSNICQESTELHFASVDDQLNEMRSVISEAVSWRTERINADPEFQVRRTVVSKNLQSGDAYITRHSNLSQVHIVFHMIVDDSVKSNDMNSRHPVILGLRNVLKTAASHDVTTLTLPLLLTHEMTEEMTVSWCTRRAELVFKCVKGFMMEAASTGGAELHNLQFLVPRGISSDVFAALAAMLPSIFRVSNPLVLKTTPVTPKDAANK